MRPEGNLDRLRAARLDLMVTGYRGYARLLAEKLGEIAEEDRRYAAAANFPCILRSPKYPELIR